MPKIKIDKTRVVSNQRLFNLVAKHLFTQGQRALNAAGACCYRDAEGRTCSIGCRIPDSEYTNALEDQPVASAEVRISAAIPEAQIDLAGALRTIHDWPENWTTTERMKRQLSTVAWKFNLSARTLNTLAFPDR